jgi:hypothetical protein
MVMGMLGSQAKMQDGTQNRPSGHSPLGPQPICRGSGCEGKAIATLAIMSAASVVMETMVDRYVCNVGETGMVP